MPDTNNNTVLGLLQTSLQTYAERPALSAWRGGAWDTLTYAELWDCAQRFARGLIALGVKPGDRVAIAAESCPRWVIADLGVLAAGAVNTAMFPSLPPAQMEYILSDSGSWLLLVGSTTLLQKALAVREHMPDLQIVLLEGEAPAGDGVVSFAELLAAGDADTPLPEPPTGTTLASLIYTSGTTGRQKGVMLTHGNFVANVTQCRQVLVFQPDDVLLSVLPLNHVFERTTNCYLPLSCGSHVYYCENLRRLREHLPRVRPTYMILVPRFLEALRDALVDRVANAPAWRRVLFAWGTSVGRERLRYLLARRPVPPHVAAEYRLADRVILRRVRHAIGLDRCKNLVSGAAALAVPINEFFQTLGLEVLEGYGLTEASPVVAVNRPGAITVGTVGPPLPGVEVALGEHDEVLVRGPNVMLGYYKLPQETEAALDAEGWLHTGDVGALRGDNLCITDRLKDLLVLTNGKNVAPQPIELCLCASPYISQAVVLGDSESYVTALIVPAFERLNHWARTQSLELPDTPEAVTQHEAVQGLIRREIKRLTEHLADFEKVRDFRLLPQEFTVEGGELTPTLKLKRRVIVHAYEAHIASMYGR
jgi:long-chain acyl-CoA synthetase